MNLFCTGVEVSSGSQSSAVEPLEEDDNAQLENMQSSTNNDDDTDKSSTTRPICWTSEQYHRFKKDNTWLFCNLGKLGCSICRDFLNVCGRDVSVSREWSMCEVEPYGATRAAQQTSLRKKMHLHRASAAHNNAESALHSQEEELLSAAVANQLKQQHEETCRVFRTAYYVAKSDRPYTDHPALIELQQLNDVGLGRILHSNVICSDIIDHVAVEMRRAVIKYMLTKSVPCAVLVDESTSLSKSSCLIVYVRTTFDNTVGPITFFLDIVELSSTTAEGIEQALLDCLTGHGLTVEFLREHWVGFGADGASVMLGSKSGVAVRLKVKFPQIVAWHCFNHRLELCVADAVKCCTEINHFKSFLDLLYSTYSMSPKLQRELTECAQDLEIQLNRIGRIFDVRWVASSSRTVKAVWKSYEALYNHFSGKLTETKIDPKEKAKFAGMKKKLENPFFIQNLGLMYDALEELADLSLALQKADITLPVANKLIARQIEVFMSRKDSDSEFYSEACHAVASGNFKGVPVQPSSGKEKLINKGQFYQALADSLTTRLLPETDKALCKAVEILDVATVATLVPPEFGEAQLKFICTMFGLCFSETKNAYRDFKESAGKIISDSLKKVMHLIDTIPVSTAECERGFSRMNLVCTSLRSRLSVKHMSSLMFIGLSGPPLALWKPLPFVKAWLALNRRDATCTNCPSTLKVLASDNATLMSLWNAM